jgi:hypothetical protein
MLRKYRDFDPIAKIAGIAMIAKISLGKQIP